MFTFAKLVDEVRKLDGEQMEELKSIIDHARIEKARKEFVKSHKAALKEEKTGKLKFSSDINFLKRELSLK